VIVRSAPHALHLITQPDHASLSARIMRHWAPLHHSARRASILLAIEEHDNGWREPDAEPSIDPATGRVQDFITAAVTVRQGVWPRAIGRLHHDRWAAALVAQHAITVYDRFAKDPEWVDFFADIASRRDALLASSETLEQLLTDYANVRIGDLISLMFCNQWRDEQRFGQWRFAFDDDCVVVTPDPFEERDVPFAIAAREIPDVLYQSDEHLRQTLQSAPIVTLHGVATGRLSR
jgi:hypothetical protein